MLEEFKTIFHRVKRSFGWGEFWGILLELAIKLKDTECKMSYNGQAEEILVCKSLGPVLDQFVIF